MLADADTIYTTSLTGYDRFIELTSTFGKQALFQLEKSGFRQDINGLRAWAVVAVLLFHFNIPSFSGGFAGVDVFFVISGFLMTDIIVSGLVQNRFRFGLFYLARAKRIFPALIALALVWLAACWSKGSFSGPFL